VLSNVEAVLRGSAALVRNVKIAKTWPGYGLCSGVIVGIGQAESTLYPGTVRTVYKVKYDMDGTEEELEEEEIRPLVLTADTPERKKINESLAPAFTYLEKRLTGDCTATYSYEHTYTVVRVAQMFDPGWASVYLTPPMVDELPLIVSIGELDLIGDLKRELPAFTAAIAYYGRGGATPPSLDELTPMILKWWREHANQFPTWAKAARIVFAMPASSAGAERIFSLLKAMYGSHQVSALADQIQASLMLRYNKRAVG
jgi:hypothetical protein